MADLELVMRQCHEMALHTYSTSYIYGLRAKTLNKLIKAITLLGFAVPVLIGAVVSSYGLTSQYSLLTFQLLTPLAIVQLLLSTLSLIYGWEDKKSYYQESMISNRQLSEDFTNLATFPMNGETEQLHAYQILIERNRNREEQDDKYLFDEKEYRKGLRYGLRQFQRRCSACDLIPISMESTQCGVCGNF